MGQLKQYDKIIGGTVGTAEEVGYDNSTSGLTATNTQAAIDEISSDLSELTAIYSGTSVTTLVDIISTLTDEQYLRSSLEIDGTMVLHADYTSVRQYIRVTLPSNTMSLGVMMFFDTTDGLVRAVKELDGTLTKTTQSFNSWRLIY